MEATEVLSRLPHKLSESLMETIEESQIMTPLPRIIRAGNCNPDVMYHQLVSGMSPRDLYEKYSPPFSALQDLRVTAMRNVAPPFTLVTVGLSRPTCV
jgi:hypothetical protein